MNNGFISASGISYAGTLKKIRKSPEQLQPFYEAFTNSLEAIISANSGALDKGRIVIRLLTKTNIFEDENDIDFVELQIEDNGIGFNEIEFDRFINLNDDSKAFFNKGSGRIQYLHFFDRTEYESIYSDSASKTGFKKRTFTLSKSDAFLKKNAIVKLDSNEDFASKEVKTILKFKSPISKKDFGFLTKLTIEELKEKIINRYLALFCENRQNLPTINLEFYIDDHLKSQTAVIADDVPNIDKQEDIIVPYYKLSPDGKTFDKQSTFEKFNLKSFLIPKENLKKNGLMLTSKGEIAKEIKLESLLPEDHIEDRRYLFLISGDYITSKDGDVRGKLAIPTAEEFKKNWGSSDSPFTEEEILMDDIQDEANSKILSIYPEIQKRNNDKILEIEELQDMFLLDPRSIKEAKIKLNDTEERILEKVYAADARLEAKKDAEIKQRVDQLKNLNPGTKDFQKTFEKEIIALAKAIPLQNRTALTHYVARRKLILELLSNVLDKELLVQNDGSRNNDEKLLHNLIFQQKSNEPSKSDLWVINEDFVYFSGSSEGTLEDIELNGVKIMKETLTADEIKYRDALNEKNYEKRPDILLFPDEGKCIIVELKNPTENVSDHLLQINKYASLIRNLSKPEFKFTTFYGYLVGQKLDADDIADKDSAFVHAYNFDYVFKPYYRVPGKFGRIDGSLYTEAITYRTLIERSLKRNKIFIDLLTKSND